MMGKNERIIFGVLILLGLNLLFLDYKLFFSKKNKGEEKPVEEKVSKEEFTTPLSKSDLNVCPDACITKINEATVSIPLKSGEKTVERIIEKQTQTTKESEEPKEYFIPLGASGSTTEGSWKDIPGMEVTLDRGKYPAKITVNWQASLKVKDGNGEAHARLFNVTKNVAVDYSEITSIGGEFKNVTSQNINLAQGVNLYRVQMFSTTQYEVYIQGARIKITVE